MRFTIKEFRDFVDNIEDNSRRIELEKFYAEVVSGKSPDGQNFAEEMMVDWTPKHQKILEKLESLVVSQNLEMHSKLKPRLRRWIDGAVKRGCKCIMSQERDCPCDRPADQGCPLLRHKI